jgi:hypothetical protein
MHDNADWREAAHAVNGAVLTPETPVICPSPFVEAQWPVWKPDYKLPGFFYSHVAAYPIRGRIYSFPFTLFKTPPEAEQYAEKLSFQTLLPSRRFIVYGGKIAVDEWQRWFARRPEFSGWEHRDLGNFGDSEAVLFAHPAP